MALTDDYNAALNPIVQAQVTSAFYITASNVYSESAQTAGHTTRAAFATEVANGKVNWQALIAATVAFGSLTSTSTDATVNNAVAALWSMFAGA